VIHQRQGLALALEARDDLAAVHPGLDDLQRHVAAKRMRLLSVVDHAHTAFPDWPDQFEGTDLRSECDARGTDRHRGSRGGVRPEQFVGFFEQAPIAAACLPHVGRAFDWLHRQCRSHDIRWQSSGRSYVGRYADFTNFP
jgi:hypothetical protein